MFDINSSALILLAEACVILLTALIIVVWLQIKSKKKRRNAVEQLVSQFKVRSKTRVEETEVFLQQVYDLNDAELAATSKTLELQERLFLQKMVDILIRSDVDQITSLDTSIMGLIDTYKNLKPPRVEVTPEAETVNTDDNLELLRTENAALTEELKMMREKMTGILSEFGDMFGGFKADSPDGSSNTDKVIGTSDRSDSQDSLNAPDEIDLSETESDNVGKKTDLP
jgi:hypothetical protein